MSEARPIFAAVVAQSWHKPEIWDMAEKLHGELLFILQNELRDFVNSNPDALISLLSQMIKSEGEELIGRFIGDHNAARAVRFLTSLGANSEFRAGVVPTICAVFLRNLAEDPIERISMLSGLREATYPDMAKFITLSKIADKAGWVMVSLDEQGFRKS